MSGLCAPLPTLRPHPHGWPDARLGADVDRYSFTVVDLHHLLLAGLPAHSLEPRTVQAEPPSLIPQVSEGSTRQARYAGPGCLCVTRQIVPEPSSLTKSEPSLATAMP